MKYAGYDLKAHFKEEWQVTEYSMNEIIDAGSYVDTMYTLEPQAFRDHESAVTYLNSLDDAFDFTLNSEKYLTLKIKANVRIYFSSTLQDCLALDKNYYFGKDEIKATRRIFFNTTN